MEQMEWKKKEDFEKNEKNERVSAISDCCMVAAESFCGMEQTTARV